MARIDCSGEADTLFLDCPGGGSNKPRFLPYHHVTLIGHKVDLMTIASLTSLYCCIIVATMHRVLIDQLPAELIIHIAKCKNPCVIWEELGF